MFKFLLVFLLPVCVLASPSQQERRDFANSISLYKQSCQGNCLAPYSQKLIYDRDHRVREAAFEGVKDQLRQAAYDQAQIWADTILEGDFVAAGHTRVDSVTAVYKDDQLLAYKVTYSEKGWSTAECDYDGHRASLTGCPVGRISESSFISPKFDLNLTDEDDYADFAPN